VALQAYSHSHHSGDASQPNGCAACRLKGSVRHQYQREKAQLQGGRAGSYPGLSPPCPPPYHKLLPRAVAGIIKHAQVPAAVGTLPPSTLIQRKRTSPPARHALRVAAALRLGRPQRGCAPQNGNIAQGVAFPIGLCSPRWHAAQETCAADPVGAPPAAQGAGSS
jgi:hypothetical protein